MYTQTEFLQRAALFHEVGPDPVYELVALLALVGA